MTSQFDADADADADADTDAPALDTDAVDSAFRTICDAYEYQFEAISELILELIPRVEEMDAERSIAKVLNPVMKKFTRRERDALRVFVDDHALRESSMKTFMVELLDNHWGDAWGRSVAMAMYRDFDRAPKIPILAGSLLASVVSAFESCLASVTSEYYRASPNALEAASGDSQKEFSLQDLKAMSTLDDAIEIAIDSRVETMMFGSLASWRKFYKEKLKIDFAELADDWAGTSEIFERRHVIVHNGGRASSRYVRSVGTSNAAKNDPLEVDAEYLRAALDQLLTLGFLVAIATWKKFSDSEDAPSDRLQSISYLLLERGRYDAVKVLCNYGLEHPTNAEDRDTYRVNFWLAEKNLGNLEKVRAAITEWDVSASRENFQLAKACLLDDLDHGFLLLRSLIAQGSVAAEDLLGWPLLAGLREDERFAELQDLVSETLTLSTEIQYMVQGRKVFHRESCSYLSDHAVAVSPSHAQAVGARACKACVPTAA